MSDRYKDKVWTMVSKDFKSRKDRYAVFAAFVLRGAFTAAADQRAAPNPAMALAGRIIKNCRK